MLRDLFSLFPAYAGVILLHGLVDQLPQPFPRIRGGDPTVEGMKMRVRRFSPHTRG